MWLVLFFTRIKLVGCVLACAHAITYQVEKTVILISQEEVSSRISEVIDWSLIKSESLTLCKNIHIVTYNNGYTVQAFKHSGGEKVAGLSCKTDESIKSLRGGYIFFIAIL